MKNTFVYQAKRPIVKVLQITDPHLFKDGQTELLGVNTQASFGQVLKEIQQNDTDFDLIFATGDLVQDGSEEGYRRFVEMLKPFGKSVFWIPGNHDFQPKMVEYLNQAQNIFYLANIGRLCYWIVRFTACRTAN